jgi:hypothetical protein
MAFVVQAASLHMRITMLAGDCDRLTKLSKKMQAGSLHYDRLIGSAETVWLDFRRGMIPVPEIFQQPTGFVIVENVIGNCGLREVPTWRDRQLVG